ncbi:MAG: S8 family serine peptidase, partial [Planctomycetota bacterium]
RIILFSLIIVIAIGSSTDAKVRDVKAIGEEAVRKGLISSPPKGRDFTKIPPNASYRPGELLVRFAPRADGKQRAKAEKDAVLASIAGGAIKHSYQLVPGLTVVKLPEGQTVQEALKRFNAKGEILYGAQL